MARVVHVPHQPCPNCQRSVVASQAVCPYCQCSMSAPTRQCPRCGSSILASHLACTACGHSLVQQPTVAADPAIAQIIANSPAFQDPARDDQVPVALRLRIGLGVLAVVVGSGLFLSNTVRLRPFIPPNALLAGRTGLHEFWTAMGPGVGVVVILATLFGGLLGHPSYTLWASMRRWQQAGWGFPGFRFDLVGVATSAAASLVYICLALAVCCLTKPGPTVGSPTGLMASSATNLAALVGAVRVFTGAMACCAVCHLGNSIIGWKQYLR